MKTYLSVDIDFWNDWRTDTQVHELLRNLCMAVRKSCIPMRAMMNHQQMLKFVNASHARRLVNIDMHSDLGDRSTSKLNCGTWVSYVKWRHDGIYQWIHKHSAEKGECNQYPPIFTERSTYGLLSDWGYVGQQKVKRTPSVERLMKLDIVDFGLVMSPAYANYEFIPVFREIVKEFRIPYIKGRWHENQVIENIRPPGGDGLEDDIDEIATGLDWYKEDRTHFRGVEVAI